MKTLFIILLLLPSIFIKAQIIDWSHFSTKNLNDTMYSKMTEFNKIDIGIDLVPCSIAGPRIYNFIKRNHRKLKLQDLGGKLYDILRQYDSEFVKISHNVGCVGIIDSISCKDIKSYQEIANRCITDWKNSPSDYLFMGWGGGGESICYYDSRTKVVYIYFAFFR